MTRRDSPPGAIRCRIAALPRCFAGALVIAARRDAATIVQVRIGLPTASHVAISERAAATRDGASISCDVADDASTSARIRRAGRCEDRHADRLSARRLRDAEGPRRPAPQGAQRRARQPRSKLLGRRARRLRQRRARSRCPRSRPTPRNIGSASRSCARPCNCTSATSRRCKQGARRASRVAPRANARAGALGADRSSADRARDRMKLRAARSRRRRRAPSACARPRPARHRGAAARRRAAASSTRIPRRRTCSSCRGRS